MSAEDAKERAEPSRQERGSRWRVYTKWSGFAMIPAGLLLAVLGVGGELWLRAHAPPTDLRALAGKPLQQHCYRPSMRLGYEPVPGLCERDDRGLRVVGEADPEAIVLLLGDSIAEQHAWVQELAQRMHSRKPQRRMAIWNAGVAGYDTCSELARLEGLELSRLPDLLLLQLCINDFMLTATTLPLPSGWTRLFFGPRYTDVPPWLLKSHLLTWAAIRYGASRQMSRTEIPGDAHVGRCLDGIRAWAGTRKIPVRVLVFPALVSGEPEGERSRANLAALELEHRAIRLLERGGVPLHALREGLERQGPLEQFRAAPGDLIHLNLSGQSAVARVIVEEVLHDWNPDAPGRARAR